MDRADSSLPPIPAKRYFTIGEVSELCLVKPYVLRYWEQEFVQLKPMKRRGNRRYYQHHEVLLIRRIRELLYEQGFTISGARNQLTESGVHAHGHVSVAEEDDLLLDPIQTGSAGGGAAWSSAGAVASDGAVASAYSRSLKASLPVATGSSWGVPDLTAMQSLDEQTMLALREALVSIRDLLS